jgi:predicted amidohydrolase
LSGSIVSALRELAIDNSIAVIGSFRERSSPLPLNTSVAIGTSGEVLAKYSKCHLFSPAGEDQRYSPGTTLSVFDISGMRFGIAICYDLRFSSVFEGYVDLGADAVIVPAAWPATRGRQWELFLQSRAAEYQLYIIGVNTTGITPVDTYAGGSLIVDPTGSVVSRLGAGEGLICGPADPEIVTQVRQAMPVARDRREGFRRLLSGRNP